jgi:hypothetical protein
MISPRRLGRAAVQKQDESSIPLLCRHLLVEALGQGFVEIAPCHGNGIDRLGRPGKGLIESCVRRGIFLHRFAVARVDAEAPVHGRTAGRHLP